jgi:hypothetical protein
MANFSLRSSGILREAKPAKRAAIREPSGAWVYTLVLDRIPEDLAGFLFHAATMRACATLEPGFHVVVEVLDQEIIHRAV